MEEIIEFLEKIISYQTTKDNPKEIEKCFQAIERKFAKFFIIKKYNFKTRPIRVLKNTPKNKLDFILAGHIDVAPAEKNQFKLKIKGNKLWGRGVFDMKGPLIAAIFAISNYLKENNSLKIAIFITSDEEIDGLSTKYLIEKINYRARFAILPDGGKDLSEIIVYQKGFLQLHLKIFGKPAHASRPWEGENPIERAMLFYQKLLKKFPPPKNEKDWKTTVSLTKFNSGKALNQIPKDASLGFDIRYLKEKTKVLKEIKCLLREKDKLEIIADNPPFMISSNNPYLKKLKSSIEKLTNKKVKLVKECGTSDAVFFAQNKIPAVLFRPKGGGAHQNEEWIEKDSLFLFYQVILNFLKEFY